MTAGKFWAAVGAMAGLTLLSVAAVVLLALDVLKG